MITENSVVIFNSNKAYLGGAVCFTNNSSVLFKVKYFTGFQYGNIILIETFILFYSTYRSVNKGMMTVFINNSAIQGGAISVPNKSILQFEENSFMIFMHNKAKGKGRAISCHGNSNILFKGKSHTIFIENKAELGGTVHLEDNATIIFKGNSLTEFTQGEARLNGGTLFYINAKGIFLENSTVRHINNTAKSNGGTVGFRRDCDVKFDDNSIITFHNN